MDFSPLNSVEQSQTSLQRTDWRSWSRAGWNRAIFLHYFNDDGLDLPIYRIPVTPHELNKIVGEADIDVDEVQEAFLKTVRTQTHIDFNRRLANYNLDPRLGWRGGGIPPFFIDLAFSCLVANPPDNDIRKDGDFRRRLALLLGHEPGVNYPLAELADLWRAFSRWLDAMRNNGRPYRRLELPNPGNEVRIGYSLNLAFPSRKDHDLLIDILANQGFVDDPPIPTVLDIVSKNKNRFSENFWDVYSEFRKAFVERKGWEPESYPFWGAVKDAITSLQIEQTKDEEQHSLKLVFEPDGFVLLLSTRQSSFPESELKFTKVDTPYGEFSNVLCNGDTSASGFHSATEMLLSGNYREHISGAGWPAIKTAIRQEVLLFAKTGTLSWELTFVRRDEGELKGLIRTSLVQPFLDAFPSDKRPETKESKYGGWTEIEQFPAGDLPVVKYSEWSPLSDIRCLQPTVTGISLRLIGGCPVNGGFLGIPHLLPLVRFSSSKNIDVDAISEDLDPISLQSGNSSSSDYCFPNTLQQPLSGQYRITCRHEGRVIAQKQITFYSEIHVNKYHQPTEPQAWEMEAGGPDVVTYQSIFDYTAEHEDNGEDIVAASKSIKTSYTVRDSSSRLIDDSYQDLGPNPVNYGNWDEPAFIDANRFMEICGGLAMNRKGIAESGFIELMSHCLNLSQYRHKWDVLRAWLECGYFERLHHRRWRRTEYYARTPRFSLQKLDDGRVRGTLLGLATSAYRNRANDELLKNGCTTANVSSSSKWVAPPPAWISCTATPFANVSNFLGLEPPNWTEPVAQTLWSMSDVIDERNSPPRYYECLGCWGWAKGQFSRGLNPSHEGVEVLRFHRPDRPDHYQVTVDGEIVWWTISRNWSLLLAHELAGDPVYALTDSNQAERVSIGQVYLPLPVGRYLSQTGSRVSGPIECTDRYVYTFQSNEERTKIFRALFDYQNSDITELRSWARWILTLSRRPELGIPSSHVPIPSDVCLILSRFNHIPEIYELSQTKLAPHLVHRVRRGISRFSEVMEV